MINNYISTRKRILDLIKKNSILGKFTDASEIAELLNDVPELDKITKFTVNYHLRQLELEQLIIFKIERKLIANKKPTKYYFINFAKNNSTLC
jgi:DNA-binding transcriptional ArsR family regulator